MCLCKQDLLNQDLVCWGGALTGKKKREEKSRKKGKGEEKKRKKKQQRPSAAAEIVLIWNFCICVGDVTWKVC